MWKDLAYKVGIEAAKLEGKHSWNARSARDSMKLFAFLLSRALTGREASTVPSTWIPSRWFTFTSRRSTRVGWTNPAWLATSRPWESCRNSATMITSIRYFSSCLTSSYCLFVNCHCITKDEVADWSVANYTEDPFNTTQNNKKLLYISKRSCALPLSPSCCFHTAVK